MSQHEGLIDNAVQRLTEAEEKGILTFPDTHALRSRVTDFRDALRNATQEIANAGRNEILVFEAQREIALSAFEEGERAASDLISEVQDRLGSLTKRLEDRAMPVPPDGDSSAVEAKLANTRADAQLALSAVPPEDLIEGLQDLAEEGDAFMRHLILGTPWPVFYLRSRGQPDSVVILWQQTKRDLMPLVVDENGMEAVQRLERLKPVMQMPLFLVHALDIWKRAALGRFSAARAS